MRFVAPATLDQLQRAVPAVFSTEPHPNMMKQYEFVPTSKILEAFLDSGYGVSRAQQVDGRDHFSTNSGKHILCFRKMELFKEVEVGEYIPEIVFTGAHDGSSGLHFFQGLFRIICANGMMVGEKWATHRVIHKKGAEQAALAAAAALMESMPLVNQQVRKMLDRILTTEEKYDFAEQAMALRYDYERPFESGQLLQIRRSDDAGENLWRVMNRIQENLMRGGMSYNGPKGRAVTAKPIERISRDVDINRGLWDIADQFLEVDHAAS